MDHKKLPWNTYKVCSFGLAGASEILETRYLMSAGAGRPKSHADIRTDGGARYKHLKRASTTDSMNPRQTACHITHILSHSLKIQVSCHEPPLMARSNVLMDSCLYGYPMENEYPRPTPL